MGTFISNLDIFSSFYDSQLTWIHVLSKRRYQTLDLQEPGFNFILPTKCWKNKNQWIKMTRISLRPWQFPMSVMRNCYCIITLSQHITHFLSRGVAGKKTPPHGHWEAEQCGSHSTGSCCPCPSEYSPVSWSEHNREGEKPVILLHIIFKISWFPSNGDS